VNELSLPNPLGSPTRQQTPTWTRTPLSWLLLVNLFSFHHLLFVSVSCDFFLCWFRFEETAKLADINKNFNLKWAKKCWLVGKIG
jgi:hypothetical protein